MSAAAQSTNRMRPNLRASEKAASTLGVLSVSRMSFQYLGGHSSGSEVSDPLDR